MILYVAGGEGKKGQNPSLIIVVFL